MLPSLTFARLVAQAALFVCLIACAAPSRADEHRLRITETRDNYTRIDWPRHFSSPEAQAFDATPSDNPTTDAGATLGRALFYDVRLSADGKVSCASCHVQSHGFSDPRKVSAGHSGRQGDRNSMGLVNLRFARTGLFWDERVATLEEQVVVPLQSPVEMGITLDQATAVVTGDPQYAPLVKAAFGDEQVTTDRMAKALAQFIRSLVSFQSKYDEGLARVESMKDDFPNFTAAENLGKAIFREKCSICHQQSRGQRAESFEMFAALNDGTNVDGEERDGGQGDLTFDPASVGLFKAASLRNIERTAPYMHDGRFATLEDVVEHYSTGVHKHPTASGFVFRMQFSDEEKAGLIAFLKTLTDPHFLSDPKFANPWTGGSAASTATQPTATAAIQLVKLTAEQRDALVASGKGLPAGETLPWLLALDQNGDSVLDGAELASVAQLMLKNGISPRLNTQRFNRNTLRIGGTGRARSGPMALDKNEDGKLTKDEAQGSYASLFAIADLNGDAALSAAEVQHYQGFQRLIEIDDQGRDRARVDRFLGEFGGATLDRVAAKQVIQSAQQGFAEKQLALNSGLADALNSAMGAEKYGAFQDLVLARPNPRPNAGRPGDDDPAKQLIERLLGFDGDMSGTLSGDEIEKLAAVLDESPGGFGQATAEYPNVQMHARRLLAFGDGQFVTAEQVPDRLAAMIREADDSGDGRVTLAEAEAMLRRRGFRNLLTSGVYVGGGFGNVFGSAELLVDKLGLDPSVATEVKDLMQRHQGEVSSTLSETVDREYRRLVALRPTQEVSLDNNEKPVAVGE